MDLALAIRRVALAEVVGDGYTLAYFYRKICRWYSREFSTPLHEVEKLPITDVLTHYYESHYEDLMGADRLEDLEEERIKLTETEAERKIREGQKQEEVEDDDAFLRAAEKEEAEKAFPEGPVPSTELKDLMDGDNLPPDVSMRFDTSDLD